MKKRRPSKPVDMEDVGRPHPMLIVDMIEELYKAVGIAMAQQTKKECERRGRRHVGKVVSNGQ